MWDELTNLIRHAAVYGVGRILNKGIGFLLIPLYTHYFSQSDYGVMEIINLGITIVGFVLACGLGSALMRFYYAGEDAREKKQTVSTALFFSLLTGLVIAALVYIKADAISRFLLGSSAYATLIRLTAAASLFSFSSDVGLVFLRAQKRSTLYVVVVQGGVILSCALNVYFVVVKKFGVAGVFYTNALMAAATGLFLMVFTIKDVGLGFSPAKLKELLRFGAPLIFPWLAAFVLNYSDRFFLQRFSNLSEVGVYSLAYKFGYIVSLLAVQPFLLIWEAQCYEVAKREDAKYIFGRIFVYYSVGLIALAFAMSLIIQEAFEFMVDAKFMSAYRMVPLIAFAYVVQGMGIYFEAGLLIQKKTKTLAGISIVASALCLLLNLVLIYFWHAWGACLSTILSFAVLSGVTYWYSQHLFPFGCDLKVVAKVAFVAVVLLGVAWAVPIPSLVFRLIAKALMVSVFLWAALKLSLQGNEKHEFSRMVLAWVPIGPARKAGWIQDVGKGSEEN